MEGDNSGVPVPAQVSRRRSALVTRSVGSPGTSCISVAVLGAFIRVPIATGSVFTQSFKGEDGCGDRARAVRKPGLLGPGEARARATAAGGERPRLREPRPVKAKRQRRPHVGLGYRWVFTAKRTLLESNICFREFEPKS